MTCFSRYVGIDYSGAEAPVSRLRPLQVYACEGGLPPSPVAPYDARAKNWCRKEVARFMRETLLSGDDVIIGIDHGFAFPADYYRRHALADWDQFLHHFSNAWPTDSDHMYVDFVRRDEPPGGEATELRLCEQWTAGAKSVFLFDVQGSDAKSTHAGIPWLRQLRKDPRIRARVHFWPFDGFDVERTSDLVQNNVAGQRTRAGLVEQFHIELAFLRLTIQSKWQRWFPLTM